MTSNPDRGVGLDDMSPTQLAELATFYVADARTQAARPNPDYAEVAAYAAISTALSSLALTRKRSRR
jgi:hypothetical protein